MSGSKHIYLIVANDCDLGHSCEVLESFSCAGA